MRKENRTRDQEKPHSALAFRRVLDVLVLHEREACRQSESLAEGVLIKPNSGTSRFAVIFLRHFDFAQWTARAELLAQHLSCAMLSG